jgi:hypothetical protein
VKALWVRLAPYLAIPDGPRVRKVIGAWLLLIGIVYVAGLPTASAPALGILGARLTGQFEIVAGLALLVTVSIRLTTWGKISAIAAFAVCIAVAFDLYPESWVGVVSYAMMASILAAEALSRHDYHVPC